MIVIFPMLVSKNVNANIIQGLAVTLEQYIASYAISNFIGQAKEFNKYYNYKIKRGKIYQESDVSWFDIDPATRKIIEEQGFLIEAGPNKTPYQKDPTTGQFPPTDPTAKKEKSGWDKAAAVAAVAQDAGKQVQNWSKNKEADGKDPIQKPTFANATIQGKSISLEPTWVEVTRPDGKGTSRLGLKVVPMMIEGFNIKHIISKDMEKYFIGTFIAQVGRKIMRLIYGVIDRWTMYGHRPRGDIKHDLFYARTGHNGQPFVVLDKNDDIPKVFFYQTQNMLKLWKMHWGNLLMADDISKTVMFCMKKYRGMCSTFSYAMLYLQTKEMGRVFEDMEDAKKATSSLFKFNKKITQLGGRK